MTANNKKTIKGMGTKPTEPIPIVVNSGILRPVIVAPLHICIVIDRKKIPMARVTINGGRFALVIIVPLIAPIVRATAMQTAIAAGMGILGFFCSIMSIAPDVTTTWPPDKSIPPVMITKVIPSATMPTMDILRLMAIILFIVRKRGAAIEQTVTMSSNTTTIL
jgi:hypothetical protein